MLRWQDLAEPGDPQSLVVSASLVPLATLKGVLGTGVARITPEARRAVMARRAGDFDHRIGQPEE